jgi:hypothetical protein
MAARTYIDNLGNIFEVYGVWDETKSNCYDFNGNPIGCDDPIQKNENNELVRLKGVYEPDNGKCFDFNFNEIPCPSNMPKDVMKPPTVTAKRTYWWVVIVAIIAIWIAIYFYMKRKKTK